MHFFKSVNTLDIQSCHLIFDATTRLFEVILRQEKPHALSGACPSFVVAAILLGASLMLRILKSPLSTSVDHQHGAALYIEMLQFLKTSSVGKGDSSDRGGKLAEQLWKCKELFKDNNGSTDISLRVRDKLASSSSSDVILRGRVELSDSAVTTELIRNTGRSYIMLCFLT
jgi:transcriptional regulatory protein LEU3